jgi:hypothetical protein
MQGLIPVLIPIFYIYISFNFNIIYTPTPISVYKQIVYYQYYMNVKLLLPKKKKKQTNKPRSDEDYFPVWLIKIRIV